MEMNALRARTQHLGIPLPGSGDQVPKLDVLDSVFSLGRRRNGYMQGYVARVKQDHASEWWAGGRNTGPPGFFHDPRSSDTISDTLSDTILFAIWARIKTHKAFVLIDLYVHMHVLICRD